MLFTPPTHFEVHVRDHGLESLEIHLGALPREIVQFAQSIRAIWASVPGNEIAYGERVTAYEIALCINDGLSAAIPHYDAETVAAEIESLS